MIVHIISKAMIQQRATRPVINLQVAFDSAGVGFSDGVWVGFCDFNGVWVGFWDGAWIGCFDGELDGGLSLVPHKAPEQKSIYEVKSLFHLQRFWLKADAPLNMWSLPHNR